MFKLRKRFKINKNYKNVCVRLRFLKQLKYSDEALLNLNNGSLTSMSLGPHTSKTCAWKYDENIFI